MNPPEIRPARPADARAIVHILEHFSGKGLLLPRPMKDVTARIRDFMVAARDGAVEGLVALHPVGEDMAEIRSLAVAEGCQGAGWGTALVAKALEDARTMGFRKVFALTYRVAFFERMGFQTVDKRTLPQKIWSDCVHCAKFTDCDETAVILELR